jgi:outer membrane protein OmpA-like peptidoglycan-associated protein
MQQVDLTPAGRIKACLSFTSLGLMLALPVQPAAGSDNASAPRGDAAPAAAPDFSCTGHLGGPVSEAFDIHCLAPADGGYAMHAANAMEQPHRRNAPPRPLTQRLGPATRGMGPSFNPPTRRDAKTLQFIGVEAVPLAFDKSDLADDARHALHAITAWRFGRPEVTRVSLYGHADSMGTNACNYTLSEKRIQAVTAYLVAQGTSPSLRHEAPCGERMPVDEYRTPEGRKRDRGLRIFAVVR